jgi:hypothetical protein
VLESAQAISIRDGRVFHYDLMIGHMDGHRFIPDLSIIDKKGKHRYIDNYRTYSNPAQFIKLMESKAVVKK